MNDKSSFFTILSKLKTFREIPSMFQVRLFSVKYTDASEISDLSEDTSLNDAEKKAEDQEQDLQNCL